VLRMLLSTAVAIGDIGVKSREARSIVVELPPRQAPYPHLNEGPTASPRVHGMWMAGDGGDGDGGDGDGGDAGDGGTGE
jgi:hypothetical protein